MSMSKLRLSSLRPRHPSRARLACASCSGRRWGATFLGALGLRQVGALVHRSGAVEWVVVGSATGLMLPDRTRLQRDGVGISALDKSSAARLLDRLDEVLGQTGPNPPVDEIPSNPPEDAADTRV